MGGLVSKGGKYTHWRGKTQNTEQSLDGTQKEKMGGKTYRLNKKREGGGVRVTKKTKGGRV